MGKVPCKPFPTGTGSRKKNGCHMGGPASFHSALTENMLSSGTELASNHPMMAGQGNRHVSSQDAGIPAVRNGAQGVNGGRFLST